MGELKLISKDGEEHLCQYDLEDHDLISQYSWRLHPEGYAWTMINGKMVLMHRLILGLEDPKTFGDHKDGNKLNNCRVNLRVCTPAENRRNSRKRKKGTSKYKGVYLESSRNQFHSQIGIGQTVKNLGRYTDERLAAKAYDKRALEIFQEFACLNFPSSREARQLIFPWYD